ncbi:MAG: YicC family protein [Gammaproteobacteria bacterium]|uniref:YicC family protein n=1 Tax=OM182 bacterium TaxID=2510334 RepID=A0A520S5G1_9GAMM|nr:YicC family protein [Gammaproteobacteria bacterium]OUV68698.1 MAG: YicC family protein [Gammaproteobacteria bacterium TMED133]RZO77700.1 MAG: YicC family protein [OM182 bacterium]
MKTPNKFTLYLGLSLFGGILRFMTNSMTAFAQVKADNIIWEIRSLNHRYLDISFRMPESFRCIETSLRAIAKTQIFRGKLDCTLYVSNEESHSNLTLDEDLLAKLKDLQNLITKKVGALPTNNALDLLHWPGVIKEPQSGTFSQLETSKKLFGVGVKKLQVMRKNEGEELGHIVEEKLEQLASKVSDIRNTTPNILNEHQERLRSRVSELSLECDTGRLEQELVILANKSDIAEEIDRLDTHIREIRNTLRLGESIGRRLDFLMQELNREANTLSSKALSTGTTLSAVDMKVLIEQMREQIQNIE